MLEDRAYWLSERAVRTAELEKSPYNADAYLHRAFCYEKLGYFDLVAADAYKVLLLTDEALDEVGEYHEVRGLSELYIPTQSRSRSCETCFQGEEVPFLPLHSRTCLTNLSSFTNGSADSEMVNRKL